MYLSLNPGTPHSGQPIAAWQHCCLVFVTSVSLIWMGCLPWVENRWAVIPAFMGGSQEKLDIVTLMGLAGLYSDPSSHKIVDPVKRAAEAAGRTAAKRAMTWLVGLCTMPPALTSQEGLA